jgi:hypothetical protein
MRLARLFWADGFRIVELFDDVDPPRISDLIACDLTSMQFDAG